MPLSPALHSHCKQNPGAVTLSHGGQWGWEVAQNKGPCRTEDSFLQVRLAWYHLNYRPSQYKFYKKKTFPTPGLGPAPPPSCPLPEAASTRFLPTSTEAALHPSRVGESHKFPPLGTCHHIGPLLNSVSPRAFTGGPSNGFIVLA